MIELISDADFRRAWPVMAELRTDLDETTYMELLAGMRPDGYRLFAIEVDGDIKALAGISIGTNFYYRRYLWVYDLITTEVARSSGHGAALMGELERLASDEGCDTIALASGLQRSDAHRFYEDRLGYKRASYTFHKTLDRASGS